MVDALVALILAAGDNRDDGVGEVLSIGRRAALVEDHLELGLGRGQVEHGPDEVLAILGVEPRRAEYQGFTA